jgi:hypothetical protein
MSIGAARNRRTICLADAVIIRSFDRAQGGWRVDRTAGGRADSVHRSTGALVSPLTRA